MKKILIINASPNGNKSNCAKLIKKKIQPLISQSVVCEIIHLAKFKNFTKNQKLKKSFQEASAFIFVSGTYWDSWGSPLQKFLEDTTHFEGTSLYLGKPASVIILNHSVGGKSVLSRLQGVLATLGCFIPPQSGLVYGLNTDLVFKKSMIKNNIHHDDFWTLDDLHPILENLIKSIEIQIKWSSWPVDRKNFKELWIK